MAAYSGRFDLGLFLLSLGSFVIWSGFYLAQSTALSFHFWQVCEITCATAEFLFIFYFAILNWQNYVEKGKKEYHCGSCTGKLSRKQHTYINIDTFCLVVVWGDSGNSCLAFWDPYHNNKT